jgi:hypothetical protein
VLHQGGGGGGSGAFEWHDWLWPLPPPGPLVFVCAWPALALPETRTELDAMFSHPDWLARAARAHIVKGPMRWWKLAAKQG